MYIINTMIIVRFIAQKFIAQKHKFYTSKIIISSYVHNFSACYTVLLAQVIS